MDIPIVTYARAMRIAVKYTMDDIQLAIVKVIELTPPLPPPLLSYQGFPSQLSSGLGTAISRLAFVAEFPSHFTKEVAIRAFTQASSINRRPTANDLGPLVPYLAFLALMMKYREGLRNPASQRNRDWECVWRIDSTVGCASKCINITAAANSYDRRCP